MTKDTMHAQIRSLILFTSLALSFSFAIAQQTATTRPSASSIVRLNVRVSGGNGQEATELQATDFSVLDNRVTRPIVSFKSVTAQQEAVEVILVIDAVNINFERVAYARDQTSKFLKRNNGALDYPTTFAVLTDDGVEIQKGFTKDGTALSSLLGKSRIGLRTIRRSQGFWGADERVDASLQAVRQVIGYAGSLPGRKIVIWISPGWPLLSGPRVWLSSRQQNQIYAGVVAFSNELQRSDVTLYSVNPLGVDESLFREDYYQSFLKGVANSSQTDLADLSLQVLAIQSGGLALNGNNDVVEGLGKCVADLRSWYEITFEAARADHVNEYHHVQVRTKQPGLTIRTRDGYYAEP